MEIIRTIVRAPHGTPAGFVGHEWQPGYCPGCGAEVVRRCPGCGSQEWADHHGDRTAYHRPGCSYGE